MSQSVERRNPKVSRVDLATLVDICAVDSELPPFQGQSSNVSGRGMQVRTGHLPEIGQPLVCRFEHLGREILVEGKVAWRAEGTDSGEFGVQFTAVDPESAEILKNLRPASSVDGAFASARRSSLIDFDEEGEDEMLLLESGERVRLHIDGLGAPMKASVHDGSNRKVRVGSNLEFLKMGRTLEIEALESGQRRGARVDSVNVVVNPSTAVPELVVMLRYDGMTPSPAPAVAQEGVEGTLEEDMDEAEFGEDAPWYPAALAFKGRLGGAYSTALSSMRGAAAFLWKKGEEAKRVAFERAPRRGGSSRGERSSSAVPGTRLRAQPTSAAPRRTSSLPQHRVSNVAQAGLTGGKRSPGPRSVTQKAPPVPVARNLRVPLAFGAGGVLLLGGLALLLRPTDPVVVAAPASAERAPVSSQGAPPAEAPTQANAVAQAVVPPPKASPEGIVAEVPLFGPRSVATTETPSTQAKLDELTLEKRAAAANVEDQSFDAGEGLETTFGRGKLHLPTVHRIRLDGAGSGLTGQVEASGFSVVVPGRKAMETGRVIEKRDRRILQVKASNTAEGARILFEFRGAVPPYRARLKNDFVEFLISAPEGAEL